MELHPNFRWLRIDFTNAGAVSKVVSRALLYPVGRIPELLQAFVRFLEGAPDEMDALAQLLPSEQGPRLKIDLCYCGDPRIGNDLVRPLRTLKPQDDSVKVMSYLEAQAAGGFLLAPVRISKRTCFLKKKYDPKNVLRLNQNIKPDSPSNG